MEAHSNSQRWLYSCATYQPSCHHCHWQVWESPLHACVLFPIHPLCHNVCFLVNNMLQWFQNSCMKVLHFGWNHYAWFILSLAIFKLLSLWNRKSLFCLFCQVLQLVIKFCSFVFNKFHLNQFPIEWTCNEHEKLVFKNPSWQWLAVRGIKVEKRCQWKQAGIHIISRPNKRESMPPWFHISLSHIRHPDSLKQSHTCWWRIITRRKV